MVRKRRTLFTLYFTIIAAILGLSIISPILPTIAQDLKASGIWMGMIFSGFAISRAIIMPFMGELSDKHGRKVFITPGLALLVVISILYLLAHNVYTFTGVRLLNGLAAGMVIPVITAYGGELAREGKEAKSMGAVMLMFYLGIGIGTLLGGILWHSFGMDSVFYAMSGISAAALLLVLPFLPEVKSPKATKTEEREEHPSLKTIFKDDVVKMILLIGFITAYRLGALMSFLPSHASGFNLTVAQMGIIIAAGIIANGIFMIPCGAVADKLSMHRRLLMTIIGSLVGTIIFIVPLCHNFTTLLLVNIVVGIGAAMVMAVVLDISVMIGRRVGMGLWMGIINTIVSVGIIVSPLISGAIMDSSGINSVFYFTGILSLLLTLIGYYYVRRWAKAQQMPNPLMKWIP
jgi:DHA1 family multidrug resistance protein-like MFS transporter